MVARLRTVLRRTRTQARGSATLFATIDPEITINLTPHARIGAVLAYEPVTDPEPGEDRFFEDHGLFVEELYAGFDVGRGDIQVGKIAPTFGWAADDAPGLYGGEIAGEYELVEELGINARLSLVGDADAAAGRDGRAGACTSPSSRPTRRFLSDSLFTSRERLHLSDGGVGNTAAPESFALAYTYQTRDSDDELAGPAFQAALSGASRPARATTTRNGACRSGREPASRSAAATRSRRSPRLPISCTPTARTIRVGRRRSARSWQRADWRLSSTLGARDMRADDDGRTMRSPPMSAASSTFRASERCAPTSPMRSRATTASGATSSACRSKKRSTSAGPASAGADAYLSAAAIKADAPAATDQELVRASLRDPAAYALIVRRYEPPLKRYVGRLLGTSSLQVEDVLQEVFIKAYVNLNDYDQRRPFSPWIYRIAHNEAMTLLRRRRAEPQVISGEEGLLHPRAHAMEGDGRARETRRGAY